MSADAMAGGPSEAELEQMLAQMREAPAEQVLVEVVSVLLQAAQVKLGREDARILLDAVSAISHAVAGRVDEALLVQIGEALAQLARAQVQAEGGHSPHSHDEPATDVAAAPRTPPSSHSSSSGAPEGQQRSRLWTPGA